jgi:hypothetical protein
MAHRHLSNQYFVSHVSKSLSQSLSTCYGRGPRTVEEQQPPAGAAQPIADFWKINDMLEYIENSRKELQRVRDELQGLHASYTILSDQEQQDMVEVYVAELGHVLNQMRAFDMLKINTHAQDLLAESLDMEWLFENEQKEHLTLIQHAQASYKLLSSVLRQLSEAYVTARKKNNDLCHIWPTVQASIEQINNFLSMPS